jgi:hypothetical protein
MVVVVGFVGVPPIGLQINYPRLRQTGGKERTALYRAGDTEIAHIGPAGLFTKNKPVL